jgi:hypothetical protein
MTSSVIITIDYEFDNWSLISDINMELSSQYHIQIGFVAYPASYTVGSRDNTAGA